MPRDDQHPAPAAGLDLELTGTELCVAPALLDIAGPRTTIRPVAGLPIVHIDHPQLDGWQRVIKGLFDRCAAVMALILLAPMMLTLAVAIRLSDHGPALFTQTRIGKDGAAIPDLQVPDHGRGRRTAPG